MPLALVRAYTLGLGLLAIAAALLLDGVMLRYVLQPVVRRFEAQQGGSVALPPGMRFMLDHAWARRAYNATFGILLIGVWWYLGTPAGAARLTPAPPPTTEPTVVTDRTKYRALVDSKFT